MKKKIVIFLAIVLGVFFPVNVLAITDAQKGAIIDNCSTIKESLKTTQKMDARKRVYLGGRFETILSKYITPLNVKLVEKNLADQDLLENQSNYAEAKTTFSNDFIKYQQALEELISTDCETDPGVFYGKLLTVRERRKVMSLDIAKLKTLTLKNIELVTNLKGKI